MRKTGQRKVFFSSCFTTGGTSPLRVEIRDRVDALFNSGPEKLVWIGEDFRELDENSDLPPLDKAMFCVKGVRDCDAYVAVVVENHGSPVPLPGGRTAQASFFELELYAAAVMSKPAFVFFLSGREPTGTTAAVLDLLGPALSGFVRRHSMGEDEVLRQIDWIVEAAGTRKLRHFAASAEKALTGTTFLRHDHYDPRRQLPRVRFLDGAVDKVSLSGPNFEVLHQLLGLVDSCPDYETCLAILWMAARELLGVEIEPNTDPRVLDGWDAVLAKWSSSAAWYGLHGHPLMGCLAAISSRASILQLMGRSDLPHGPFASEYYSIAKKLGHKALRENIFELALRHADLSIEAGENSGRVAIRASILSRTGRSHESVAAFRRALDLRQKEDASRAQIGEAKSELGFELIKSRATRAEGIRLLEAGVDATAMSCDGFHVRARRKLAYGYFRAGAPLDSYRELVKTHELATQCGAFDQIGKIEKLAQLIENRLPSQWRIRKG